MTVAVFGSCAYRWDRTVAARPPISAVADAAVCFVHVHSDMPIAMLCAAASWWNGAVIPSVTVVAMIAEVPALCRVLGVAPNCGLAVRVATIVVVAETKARILQWSPAVFVRRISCPLLAPSPCMRHILAATVTSSVANVDQPSFPMLEVDIVFVGLIASGHPWLAVIPTGTTVCVAPDVWLAIRVAAEIMVTETFVWVVWVSARVPMWRLGSPHLTLCAMDCVVLAAAVTVLTPPPESLVASPYIPTLEVLVCGRRRRSRWREMVDDIVEPPPLFTSARLQEASLVIVCTCQCGPEQCGQAESGHG